MFRRLSAALAVLALTASISFTASAAPPAAIPSPDEFLGRKVGEDRYLVPWPKVVEYFKALDAASDRVTVLTPGRSTLGNEMILAVLTSESNQKNLDRYKEIARRLANPDGLGEAEARSLIDQGKAIVLVTGSIHSNEVGSTQMSLELAHQLATTRDPEVLSWLDDVILLLMPSINPDGQVMVVDWYNKYLGTEFEAGPMPWLYHPYTGHDDNRDFFMLTQAETRIVNDILYRDWFAQVYLDEHQMGSTGPRMFVPPQTDPIAPEVPSLVFRLDDLIGTLMELRLEEAGKPGVGHSMIFDSYWPGGSRNTAWYKNLVGLLTEVASARVATPVYVEPGELRGAGKGIPEYGRRSNYPTPWSGGWWRLRDIMEYDRIATLALLEGASQHRRDLLEIFHRLNREAIEKGRGEPPYAWIVPPDQHDPVAAAQMVDILIRNGCRVHRAEEPFSVARAAYPAGSYVILAAQPYRPFLLTMLEPQRYPEVLTYTGGPIYEPYDVTAWSLPLMMGVDTFRADEPVRARLARIESPAWPGGAVAASSGGYLLPHAADTVYTAMNRLLKDGRKVYWLAEPPAGGARGDVFVPAGEVTPEAMSQLSRETHVPVRALDAAPIGSAFRVRPLRVGLYKPWVASMDEGWTRWLLEQYEFTFVNLSNDEIKKGTFTKKVDILLFPDVEKPILKEGKPGPDARWPFPPLPPEYAGGLDKEGGEKIKKWVTEEGGTIVALNSSADYLIELLDLPVVNVLDKVPSEKFVCPGSLLRLKIDTSLPLGWGMRSEEAGFMDSSPAFQTRPPDARFERRVVASYPADAKDILVSGYLKGGEILENRAAAVDLKFLKGRVILIGFPAQLRAQPHRTFKLFFNALYVPGLEEVRL